jgi:hypothetical protein
LSAREGSFKSDTRKFSEAFMQNKMSNAIAVVPEAACQTLVTSQNLYPFRLLPDVHVLEHSPLEKNEEFW